MSSNVFFYNLGFLNKICILLMGESRINTAVNHIFSTSFVNQLMKWYLTGNISKVGGP
jgi:hypothetical protein